MLAHPQLVILPGAKSWHLAVHVTVLASDGGGNLHDVLGVAVKSALWDMRIPRTRAVQHVRPAHLQGQGQSSAADGDAEAGGVEMEDGAQDTGMKALLKGKKRAPQRGQGGADFELLDFEADAGAPLEGREDLPISITLNLVRPCLRSLLWLSDYSRIRPSRCLPGTDPSHAPAFPRRNPLRIILCSYAPDRHHRRARQRAESAARGACRLGSGRPGRRAVGGRGRQQRNPAQQARCAGRRESCRWL